MKSYIPLQLLPIEKDGYHLHVNALVNNQLARMVVDTGASHTVFDKARVLQFLNQGAIQDSGLQAKGLGADIESYILHLDTLRFHNTQLIDYQAVLVDLSDLDQLFSSIFSGGIDGILGSDLLHLMKTVFNYKKQKIKLNSKKLPLQVLTLGPEAYHYMITIQLSNKPANFIVDTGASKTVFNKQRFSQFHPYDPEDLYPNQQPSAGIQTDFNEFTSTSLSQFTLGTLQVYDFNVLLLDLQNINYTYSLLNLPPIDGILGSDFLQQHKAIINFGHKTLRLTS